MIRNKNINISFHFNISYEKIIFWKFCESKIESIHCKNCKGGRWLAKMWVYAFVLFVACLQSGCEDIQSCLPCYGHFTCFCGELFSMLYFLIFFFTLFHMGTHPLLFCFFLIKSKEIKINFKICKNLHL